MGKILFFFLLTTTTAGYAQSPEAAIRRLMNDQTAAWNRGNIDDFMKGYWESDSLRTSSELLRHAPPRSWRSLRSATSVSLAPPMGMPQLWPAIKPAMTARTRWGS